MYMITDEQSEKEYKKHQQILKKLNCAFQKNRIIRTENGLDVRFRNEIYLHLLSAPFKLN